jgi:Holliday junction resolvase
MRKARIDRNHGEIVQALRQVGASVQSLASVGRGCPDLLVGYRGLVFVMEVKAAKGKLRPLQEEWREGWRGPVHIVRTVDEALAAIGAA